MTATKTRRLPRTLKKKLEASLTQLTPTEAGRLWLIYLHEADKKWPIKLDAYPPIKELQDAWVKRVEAAEKKGLAEGNRQQALFNGFIFLTDLALQANDWAERTESYRLAFMATTADHMLTRQLLIDSFSELSRHVNSQIFDTLPAPASRDEYARLLAWANGEGHWELSQVADKLVEAWALAQGFIELEAPEEYYLEEWVSEELRAAWPDKYEGTRQRFVEAEGDRLLAEVFKGDREALDDWVKTGAWAGPGLTGTIWAAKEAEVFDHLVTLVKAGELEGGEAVSLEGCFDSIRVEAGRIPAWAALRSLWQGWLYDHGYYTRDRMTHDPKALRGLYAIYSVDGDLEGEDLVNVVAEFVADYRAKPWGDGLAPDVDFAQLARFLIEIDTPLQASRAPDLGRVDLEAFKAAEGIEGPFLQEGEVFWVTTARSLKAKAPDLRLKPEDLDLTYLVTDFYYPTDKPEEFRADLARALRLLQSIQGSQRNYRPFTYGKNQPANFLGVEFTTPLEEAVKQLGDTFEAVATVRRVFDLLSDEYFDGLPILIPSNEGKLAEVEALLRVAEEILTDWLAKIEGDPWNIDTTTLKLVKPPAEEEKARDRAQMIVKMGARMVGPGGLDTRYAIDLGDGTDPRKAKPFAKKTGPPAAGQLALEAVAEDKDGDQGKAEE